MIFLGLRMHPLSSFPAERERLSPLRSWETEKETSAGLMLLGWCQSLALKLQ